MSYNRHKILIVSSWDTNSINHAHTLLDELIHNHPISEGSRYRYPLGPILASPINFCETFTFGPSGSKANKDDADLEDVLFEEAIEHLESFRYEDTSSPLSWVLVQYGDDLDENKVLSSSKQMLNPDG